MNRQKLWLLSTVLLAACAKSGGSTDSADNSLSEKTCGVGVRTRVDKVAAVESLTPTDPFEADGKVILARDATENSRGIDVLNEQPLSAGTNLSLTLNTDCQSRGELSAQFLSAEVPSQGLRSYLLKLERDTTVTELRERAERDTCVVGVSDAIRAQAFSVNEPDGINDPLFSQQGHLQSLNAAAAYAIAFGEITTREAFTPVTIAVIDTGIDMKHDDLKGVLWRNPREISANGIDDDRNGYVDDVNGYNFALKTGSPMYISSVPEYQHGTHVSGLAGAQGANGIGGVGVMPVSSRIMMLNVFGGSGGAYSNDIANAIRYAADNGADVINLSLGGSGRSADYESALAYAIKKGVTILAAAGNESHEVNESYFMSPGAYAKSFEGMLSVGSVDSADGSLSTYSNFGPRYVKIAAPGAQQSRERVGLLSTWPGNGYKRIQGTSMSTPVAAGAAAFAINMLRARGYQTKPALVEKVLELSAAHDPNLRSKIQDGNVLDLVRLAKFIDQNYPVNHGGGPIDAHVPDQPCL